MNWRAVTDSVSETSLASILFLQPQCQRRPYPSDSDSRVAARFLGRVFFTLLNDRDARDLGIAPVLNYFDHTSEMGNDPITLAPPLQVLWSGLAPTGSVLVL